MPTYEYKCPNCGVFEEIQKITDEPKESCPRCGAPVKKLISHNVGIVFKGSGFYCTDNRKGSAKDDGKNDKAAS